MNLIIKEIEELIQKDEILSIWIDKQNNGNFIVHFFPKIQDGRLLVEGGKNIQECLESNIIKYYQNITGVMFCGKNTFNELLKKYKEIIK